MLRRLQTYEAPQSDRYDPFLDASYTNPSSKARNLDAEPESLDMKIILPIDMFVASNLLAHIIGPIVLV